MEIILLSKKRGRVANFRVTFASSAGFVIAAAISLAIAAGAFYWTMTDQHTRLLLAEKHAWARELAHQRRQIEKQGQAVHSSLDALAMRVGQLQAQTTRLNALGSRLAELSRVPKNEFDLDSSPPLGGPEQPAPQGALQIEAFYSSLRKLSRELQIKEQKLAALESLLLHHKVQGEIAPKGSPVRAGWVSSGFGRRSSPLSGSTEFHSGLDFAAPSGSEVLAVARGVVSWSDSKDGYGKMVEIDHGNGVLTRYAHNKENLVELGEEVERGQAIALLGSTGRSTGPHVHFEVLEDGKLVDPSPYVSR